jgi:hypothetical protein
MAIRTELQSEVLWEHIEQTAVFEWVVSKFDPSGLANIPPASQVLILEEANREVKYFRWQGRTFDGRRYYATHKAMLAVTAGPGKGSHSGESIGSISVADTLAVNNPSALEGYLETHFGRQFFNLEQKTISQFDKVYVG